MRVRTLVRLLRESYPNQQRFVGLTGTLHLSRPEEGLAVVAFHDEVGADLVEVRLIDLEEIGSESGH